MLWRQAEHATSAGISEGAVPALFPGANAAGRQHLGHRSGAGNQEKHCGHDGREYPGPQSGGRRLGVYCHATAVNLRRKANILSDSRHRENAPAADFCRLPHFPGEDNELNQENAMRGESRRIDALKGISSPVPPKRRYLPFSLS